MEANFTGELSALYCLLFSVLFGVSSISFIELVCTRMDSRPAQSSLNAYPNVQLDIQRSL